jgi:hypothetical protein
MQREDFMVGEISQKLNAKNYVLATKYSDGDPQDHFCVGFCIGETSHNPPRYDVVDAEGNLFRGNGFRRIKKISKARGDWIVKNIPNIEKSGRSVWFFSRCPMKDFF